ncbi:hypothetical protein DWB77_07292 [Streptomyces hundungensis]|uniref:Transposase IS4-like domain-containing protein n=1 Tax=Streptomyces hundungensis TaxID=1077946 RepID=A0A387HMD0_9ACTN|nr:transposase [Streptomyces hundungensis]AYG85076.1 hypothetical protein DWB77_07292 [Streptomyces hundungensis]
MHGSLALKPLTLVIPAVLSGRQPRRRSPPKLRADKAYFFTVARAGRRWRYFLRDHPHWNTVYAYFGKGKHDGIFGQLNALLRRRVREDAGRSPEPTGVVIDAQSVTTSTNVPVREQSADVGEGIIGRKRSIVVGTAVLMPAVLVTAVGILPPSVALGTGRLAARLTEVAPKASGALGAAVVPGHRQRGLSSVAGQEARAIRRRAGRTAGGVIDTHIPERGVAQPTNDVSVDRPGGSESATEQDRSHHTRAMCPRRLHYCSSPMGLHVVAPTTQAAAKARQWAEPPTPPSCRGQRPTPPESGPMPTQSGARP